MTIASAATRSAPPERAPAGIASGSRTAAVAGVWATTVGSVLGPNLAGPGADMGETLGLPALGGGFVVSGVVFAVVTGGLVLLAALGLSRRGAVTPVRGSPFRLVGTAIIAGPLRPPDLSSLCLLRI